jgi:hypothetical protein
MVVDNIGEEFIFSAGDSGTPIDKSHIEVGGRGIRSQGAPPPRAHISSRERNR